MLPDFLHIGAAKAASSWLWSCLKQHPQVYVPPEHDNVNFFTVQYHQGLKWYGRTYFAQYAGQPVAGEFSNSYLCFHRALERVARDIPDVRLTMTLRNPIVRAFLSWAHIHLKAGKYGFDPDKGVGIPLEKILHHHGHAFFRLWIVPGFYAWHLERIYQLFPRDRIFIGIYDDLAADNATYLRSYCRFLGVEPDFDCSLIGRQVNPDADTVAPAEGMDPQFRAQLRQVYSEDIQKLEQMLDRDLSHWR